MKKIKYLLISIMCLMVPLKVSAASGTITVSSSSTIVVGNTVTVTVTLSSSTAMGSWELDLNYDSTYLQLTSSTAESGGTHVVGYTNSTTGTQSKSYTFKFKTLKSGSTKVAVNSYDVYANDMSSMSMSTSSKTIKIITQEELEASYSKDNYLKSLSVEGFELTPSFSKDTESYSIVVPEDTTEINISATANDSKSTVSGAGIQTVTSGTNTFEIVVKAQNGSERTYTLTVEVKDNNPINVTIDNQNYTVVKIKDYLPTANAYQETTININEFEIPAYTSEITGFTLVGLKDESGNIALYLYDEENDTYKKYTEIGSNNLIIYPMETNKILKNYQAGTITINDLEIKCYYLKDNSRFAVIYGINIETGEEGFYQYDKTDQSLIKLDEDINNLLNEYQNKMNLYSYIIIGFSAILVLMFIILLTIGKKQKTNKKDKHINKEYQEDINLIKDLKKEKASKANKENENTKEKLEEKDNKKNEIIEISEDSKQELTYDNNSKKSKKKKTKKLTNKS